MFVRLYNLITWSCIWNTNLNLSISMKNQIAIIIFISLNLLTFFFYYWLFVISKYFEVSRVENNA